jgi:hypothetical protein
MALRPVKPDGHCLQRGVVFDFVGRIATFARWHFHFVPVPPSPASNGHTVIAGSSLIGRERLSPLNHHQQPTKSNIDAALVIFYPGRTFHYGWACKTKVDINVMY